MYVPKKFALEDQGRVQELIGRYGFGLLVTGDETGAPFASHLPLLFEAGTDGGPSLIGHMARGNPQWHHFADGRPVLAVFTGPHAYVSPSWYEPGPSVPTWNYAVVHVYGTPHLVEAPAESRAILQRLVDTYEAGRPQPWAFDLPADYETAMLRGIAAFRIAVTRIEGKAKLSQNRKPEDRERVRQALSAEADPAARDTAALMAAWGIPSDPVS